MFASAVTEQSALSDSREGREYERLCFEPSGALNRVNRAHWPTKENRQNLSNFWIFPAYGKNCLRWPQIGPGGFCFPTNPDLADILGRTDLNFENFYFFFIFWTPNIWISRSQKSGFPDFQKSGFPGFQKINTEPLELSGVL